MTRKKQRGFLLNPFRFGGGAPSGDPYFSNVALLMHMDGANGSTTFLDSSPAPKTFTLTGAPQISTGQSKFGGSSCYLNGASYLYTASSTDFGFGAGDYTIELFAYVSSTANFLAVFDNRTASLQGIALYVGGSNRAITVANNAAIILQPAVSAPLNQQWHIALVKSGTTLTIYINGVAAGSVTDSRTLASAAAAYIGATYLGGQPFNGYIDELRVTKGVARYAANFIPPNAPFPNS